MKCNSASLVYGLAFDSNGDYAGFKQFQTRQDSEDGRHLMIGLSRFLAAHSPTPRASAQTYQIALRLQRGEEMFSDSQTV